MHPRQWPSRPRRAFRSRPLGAVLLLLALSIPLSGCQVAGQIVGALLGDLLGGLNGGGGGGTAPYPRRTPWTAFPVANSTGGVRPTAVATADFNNDGRVDVLATYDGNMVQTPTVVIYFQVFQNNQITWNRVEIASSPQLAGVGGVTVADVNGDGRADVLLGTADRIVFLRAPVNPTQGVDWQGFTIDQSTGGGLGQWRDLRVAQIDNEFGLDIVAANETAGLVCFFRQPQLFGGPETLTGNGWVRVTIASTERTGAFGILVDDINRDGRPDVISSAPGEANARLVWYQHPGGNGTMAWTRSTIGNGRGITRIALGDLDRDGRPDVVAMNPLALTAPGANDGIQLIWYQQPSNPATPWVGQVLAQYTSNTPVDIAIADVEANGNPDAFAATRTAGTLRWFSRRENVRSPWIENNLIDLQVEPRWIATADIDLDARPDLVVAVRGASEAGDGINWYLNPEP